MQLRARFYIDGFNLYFGLMNSGYKDCKWLDIKSLCMKLMNKEHDLFGVKYFTSSVKNDLAKKKRQDVYIEALYSSEVDIYWGQFRSELQKCEICGNDYWQLKEKKTDVNIATQLMVDTYKNEFDVAYVISGDSDLVPPIKHIREIFPSKQIFIAFPPSRTSDELKLYANSSFKIGYKKLKDCQFPENLPNKYGELIQKPKEWL